MLRVRDEFIDGNSDSVIPTLVNKTPTFAMSYNLMMGIGIVALSTVKILIYLRVNEEYGLLAWLVFTTLMDTVPFTIFLCVWILIFCVLYKIMGSL